MTLCLHLVDGVVRFERKGRDKKQVSIYPVAGNQFWLESSDGIFSLAQMATTEASDLFQSGAFYQHHYFIKLKETKYVCRQS